MRFKAALALVLIVVLPFHLPCAGEARAPSVSIEWPGQNDVVAGEVNVSGSASPGTVLVELRVDGASWAPANGTEAWVFALDTTTLPDGAHTIQCRAFDGAGYSPTLSVEFTVNNTPPHALELTLTLSPEHVSTNDTFTASGRARLDTGVAAGGEYVELSIGGAMCSTRTDRRGYYSATIQAPGEPGRYMVKARMILGNLSASAQDELEVAMPNPPDLSIVPADIFFSPPQPSAGREVLISAIVRNLGAGSASATVEFSSPSHVSESVRISVKVSWNATVSWSLPAGTHAITVRLLDISPWDADSTNNEASTSLRVYARPDLVVEALVFSNSRPYNGTVISIQARVRNIGEREARGTVSFYDGNPLSASLLGRVVVTVPANSTRIAVVHWEAALGEHEVHALVHDVDPEEATESNNHLSRALEVWPRPSPEPEQPAPGPGPLLALVALFIAIIISRGRAA
ncbi:MAG: Ig-like domain-containing protein [Thermoplasmata archaeon]